MCMKMHCTTQSQWIQEQFMQISFCFTLNIFFIFYGNGTKYINTFINASTNLVNLEAVRKCAQEKRCELFAFNVI